MGYQSPTEVMKRVGIYLGVAMPTNKKRLIDHLQGLEATRYELAEATVQWHMLLAESKERALYPKFKEQSPRERVYTELDRTTILEADTAIIRKDYEFLVKLEELVRDRLELGRQLLTLL